MVSGNPRDYAGGESIVEHSAGFGFKDGKNFFGKLVISSGSVKGGGQATAQRFGNFEELVFIFHGDKHGAGSKCLSSKAFILKECVALHFENFYSPFSLLSLLS